MSAIVNDLFPGMPWTGGSNIHRSVAREYIIGEEALQFFKTAKVQEVMRALTRADFHVLARETVTSLPLGEVEWLLTEDEFDKLVYYLVYRSLCGSKPGLKGKRIQNPATGNVFIPILIKKNVIAGIRFWAGESEGPGSWRLGFRIRFVPVNSSEEKDERERTKETLKAVDELTQNVQQLSELKEYLEIAEPISEAEKELRVRIKLPASMGGLSNVPDDPPEVSEPDYD